VANQKIWHHFISEKWEYCDKTHLSFIFLYLDEILHQKNSEAYQKKITPLLMIIIKFWIFFLKWELQDDNNDMNMHACISLKIASTGRS